jgi:cytochrome c
MRNGVIALVALAALAAARAEHTAPVGPRLGVSAPPELVAAWDTSIPPNGTGLPQGSGLARDGALLYAAQCLPCHGPEGAGKPNDRLVGGHGTLATATPVRTVGSYWPYATTLFDYIRRAMPLPSPQSLTADETYALTAYLLERNGVIRADQVMNARTLPRVVMPNRDNFIDAYGASPSTGSPHFGSKGR